MMYIYAYCTSSVPKKHKLDIMLIKHKHTKHAKIYHRKMKKYVQVLAFIHSAKTKKQFPV